MTMPAPLQIDDHLWCIDLNFQGLSGVIASYLYEDAGERVLIEIGPTSTLDGLIAALQNVGVDPASITKVLVTHIHLDHAGAAGSFLHRFPEAQLYVHEVGVRHLVDPSRLVASATRIYGDRMDQLWGAVEPVPADRVTSLTDGDVVTIGNRRLDVLYTPGHASHHVAFYDAARHAAFTGDVAAVRLQGYQYVRPPTPPPDIDLGLWKASLARLSGLRLATIYLTHFGPFSDVNRHLAEAQNRLDAWTDIVRQALNAGQDTPAVVDTLRLIGDRELLGEDRDGEMLLRYELATPYGMTVDGLVRYLRKQA